MRFSSKCREDRYREERFRRAVRARAAITGEAAFRERAVITAGDFLFQFYNDRVRGIERKRERGLLKLTGSRRNYR